MQTKLYSIVYRLIKAKPNYLLVLLSVFSPFAVNAQTNQVISNFSESSLIAAISAGGTSTFASSGTILLTSTIVVTNNAVLDGGTNAVTISGGGTVELFTVLAGVNFSLKNLTLANGMSNGVTSSFGMTLPAAGYGGGILNNGNLDLENCVLSNNVATSGNEPVSAYVTVNLSGSGGAIYNNGLITITNTLFVGNSAIGANGDETSHYQSSGSGYGGAIYNSAGTVLMGQVTFTNNSALGGSVGTGVSANVCGSSYGGAIFSSGGTIVGSNIAAYNNHCTGGQYLTGNYATTGGSAEGGGLYAAGSSVVISNGIFSNNAADGGAGNSGPNGVSAGGSIFNSGSATLVQCIISASDVQGAGVRGEGDTTASDGMGGGLYNSGTMQISGSVLSNNVVVGGSGQSTVANGVGGAIYNIGGLQLQNTLLISNFSTGGTAFPFGFQFGNAYGGGIANFGFITVSATVLSNDFATDANGSSATYVREIYNLGVIQSDTNSLVIGNFTNSPPDTFQWQYNGSNIAGATSDSFSLGNVQFGLSNSYALVVSNSNGSTTNLEILNLPPPPFALFSITPNISLTNGGAMVTITGTGFTNGATVYFGSTQAANVIVVNASNITAVIPASSVSGPVNVTITNGDFQPLILTNGFTYLILPQNLNAAASLGGSVQISFSGTPNATYFLQSTTNLLPPIQWQTVSSNNTDANGRFVYLDTNASTTPARFYRAALP